MEDLTRVNMNKRWGDNEIKRPIASNNMGF